MLVRRTGPWASCAILDTPGEGPIAAAEGARHGVPEAERKVASGMYRRPRELLWTRSPAQIRGANPFTGGFCRGGRPPIFPRRAPYIVASSGTQCLFNPRGPPVAMLPFEAFRLPLLGKLLSRCTSGAPAARSAPSRTLGRLGRRRP